MSERMKPADFLRDIVNRALVDLDYVCGNDGRLDSIAAKQLMMLTAAVESDFQHTEQKGGPARSYFQIEPLTYKDVVDSFALGGEKLKDFYGFSRYGEPDPAVQRMACKVARAKYWLSPKPLPRQDDWIGLAEYWLRIYNTHEGAGDTLKAKQKVRRYRLDALGYS